LPLFKDYDDSAERLLMPNMAHEVIRDDEPINAYCFGADDAKQKILSISSYAYRALPSRTSSKPTPAYFIIISSSETAKEKIRCRAKHDKMRSTKSTL